MDSHRHQTRKLIRKIEEWNPDVIQLHNIHGFVLQTELLFDYLKKAGKPGGVDPSRLLALHRALCVL